MEQVSKIIDGGIESKYLDIDYRPSEYKRNFNLNLNCSSLLLYMALADITRKEEEINNLQEVFLEALVECKTEEEINNFSKFMEEMAKVGGYAVQFYNNNINLINQNGIIEAKTKLETIKEDKKKLPKKDKMLPVSSKKIEGIESAYFDIKYRPKGGLKEIDIACSSLLTYMALADITRKEEQINNLTRKFCEILTMCNTPEDFTNFKTFMNIVASVGGYAIEFNSKVNDLINQNGKIKAQQLLEKAKERKKKVNLRLEAFKENFARLNQKLIELQESRMIDDEEVAILLKKFNELQSELYSFNGKVDKTFISQCDEKIEESISYLKSLYRNLEELKEASMKL